MTDEEILEETEETTEEVTEETEEAESQDLIDELIDCLNDGVDGVIFDRDVLDTNRPEDWAAVELTGQDDSEWADGQLIDQVLTADIWVCLSGRGSGIKREVQAVLREFGKTHDIGWMLKSRNYLYDLDKVMWRWVVTLYAPLYTEPEEDPEEPEDTETDPFEETEAEPEEDPEWPEMDPGEGEE